MLRSALAALASLPLAWSLSAAAAPPEFRLELDVRGNTSAAERLSACVQRKLAETPDFRVVLSSGSSRASLQVFDNGVFVAVGFVAARPVDPTDLVVKLLLADTDAKVPSDGRTFLQSALADAVYPLDQSLFIERLGKLDDLCKEVAARIDKVAIEPERKRSR